MKETERLIAFIVTLIVAFCICSAFFWSGYEKGKKEGIRIEGCKLDHKPCISCHEYFEGGLRHE